MSLHHKLATAIENGDVENVQRILSQDPNLVNGADWTPPPLHCAVLWSQTGVAEALLDAGANIEMLDPVRQTTPLRYAIMYGKTDVLPLLIERGANTGMIKKDGATAMELAILAESGQFEEYDDLPSTDVYAEVVTALQDLGVE